MWKVGQDILIGRALRLHLLRKQACQVPKANVFQAGCVDLLYLQRAVCMGDKCIHLLILPHRRPQQPPPTLTALAGCWIQQKMPAGPAFSSALGDLRSSCAAAPVPLPCEGRPTSFAPLVAGRTLQASFLVLIRRLWQPRCQNLCPIYLQ